MCRRKSWCSLAYSHRVDQEFSGCPLVPCQPTRDDDVPGRRPVQARGDERGSAGMAKITAEPPSGNFPDIECRHQAKPGGGMPTERINRSAESRLDSRRKAYTQWT